MLKPAVYMAVGGISVGPVDDTTLVVPLILTEKFESITFFNIFDPGSKVNIVGDEYGLIVADAEDDSLMTTPVKVVLQDFFNDSRTFDLKIAGPVFKGCSESCRIPRGPAPAEVKITLFIETGENQCRQKDEQQCLLFTHCVFPARTLVPKLWMDL